MFGLIYLLGPQPAFAHVQWFVDVATISMEPYRWSEGMVWVAMVASLVFLGALGWVHQYEAAWWSRLRLSSGLHKLLPQLAVLIGLLFSLLFYHQDLILVYIGLVVYALASARYPRLALAIIAACTGFSFVQGALVEKLLQPELAATFLLAYDWNVLADFGFSDRIFIFQAGVVEMVLGLALALGLAPRLAMALLLPVFAITAMLLGWTELFGHVPILMALVIYATGTIHTSAWSLVDIFKRRLSKL